MYTYYIFIKYIYIKIEIYKKIMCAREYVTMDGYYSRISIISLKKIECKLISSRERRRQF